MEWSQEQVIRLVEEYERSPTLWNPLDPLHKRSEAKYDAWHKMEEIMECDMVDLRKKLTSVFASYRREKARVRNGRRSYWFLYDRLSFMPNHVPNVPKGAGNFKKNDDPPREKRRRKTYKTSSDESDNPNDDDGVDLIDLESEVEVKLEPEDLMVEYVEPTKVHTKRRLTRSGPEKSPMRIEVAEVRRDPVVRQDPEVRREGKDECDSFGEYIAMSLRKHDERTRATMKQAINNIIFELEMKKYNNEQYTVLISDVNPLNGYGT